VGKKNKPKLSNCSVKDVSKTLKKLGGFEITNGSRHTIIKHIKSGKKSTIPRHNPIDKHLLRDFVDEYLVEEFGFTEDEVYKYLWC
jgi:predicted RNA binding protein YcfA (HicA-like mRNA interferase family)